MKMEELLLVLLGIGIWQFVVAIIVFSTDDEEKVFKIGIGAIGWIMYALVISFAKITKIHSRENQAKRIVKSAKRQLKKSKKNWLKWYKKYGKYSSNAWDIVRTQHTEVLKEMRETGFDYNNSKNI